MYLSDLSKHVSKCVIRGMDWDTNLHGKGWTVKRLLSDLYEKAGSLRHWGLIRMACGMLHRKVEELDEVTAMFNTTAVELFVLAHFTHYT